MRIALDTNVLVSAFISKHGHPARLIDVILTFPEIKLVLSEPILLEFREVLLREEVRKRFDYSHKDIESFVRNMRGISSMITVESKFKVIKEDPKDDIVINTAFDAKADWIVSGDSHLRKMRRFRNIRIVNPKQMIRVFARSFGELMVTHNEIGNPSP